MATCFITRKSMNVHLWLPVLILCFYVEYIKGTSTNCSTSVQGTAASITCHFSENLHMVDFNIGIVIQKYALSETSTDADPVLDCFWQHVNAYFCVAQPGYSYNNTITDKLIVKVTNLTSDFEGRYECRVVSRFRGNHQQCILTKNADDSGRTDAKTETHSTLHIPKGTPSTSSPERHLTSHSTIADTTQMETDTDRIPKSSPGGFAGIVVGVVLGLLTVAVAVVVLWKRRKRCLGEQSIL